MTLWLEPAESRVVMTSLSKLHRPDSEFWISLAAWNHPYLALPATLSCDYSFIAPLAFKVKQTRNFLSSSRFRALPMSVLSPHLTPRPTSQRLFGTTSLLIRVVLSRFDLSEYPAALSSFCFAVSLSVCACACARVRANKRGWLFVA